MIAVTALVAVEGGLGLITEVIYNSKVLFACAINVWEIYGK